VITSITRLGALAAAAVILSAGCGSSSSSSTASPTPAGPAPAATTASQMAGGAPTGSAATVPADLHCTDAIVWVNASKKTYHMSGDKWYGRTKHGEYMCQATAEGKGYHLAGTPNRHTGSNMSGATAQPAPTSSY